ncbi:MAG: M81 family metallopeptidase [Polyangiaceae bacterium]
MTARIAYARINQETNALSPVTTSLEDFRSTHFLEGEALSRAAGPGGFEVAQMFRRAELAGFLDAARAHARDVTPVPLFSAWAVASGPLTRATFDSLLEKLVTDLKKAGRVDGVYLSLHGAMGVVGVRDPEKEILEATRTVLGQAPLVVTYDLHANLTKERVEACDALQSYQTNPHRDHARVGRRAGEILIGMLQGRLHPTVAWRSLPMILGGGSTIDFLPPMVDVFLRMKWLERDKRVLGTSVNMCHPWNNHPSLGWSTAVVTDRDPALAESLADDLAERCWEKRHKQPPVFASPEEAIRKARDARLARRLGVVMIADASDVVTAGAPGENTALLERLIEDGKGMIAYVPLRDPAAVKETWDVPEGREIEVSVGGKLDPSRGRSLVVKGRVVTKRHLPGFERMVVLAVGDVRLVLMEGPAITIKPSFFRDVGLDPWKADIIVVKNFFPFLLFFAPMNRKTIFVRTSGVTDFDAARELSFDGPVHPFQRVEDWRAADARRRGLAT